MVIFVAEYRHTLSMCSCDGGIGEAFSLPCKSSIPYGLAFFSSEWRSEGNNSKSRIYFMPWREETRSRLFFRYGSLKDALVYFPKINEGGTGRLEVREIRRSHCRLSMAGSGCYRHAYRDY